MHNLIREISICDIENISIGHAQNDDAKTGVSVGKLCGMKQATKAVEASKLEDEEYLKYCL